MPNLYLVWAHIRMFFSKINIVCLIFVFGAMSILASPIYVTSVTDDFASIVKAIGGEHVTSYTLIKGSQDLHAVQPKPSMVLKVKQADLLVRLGMKQDSFVDSLIQVSKNTRLLPGQVGHLDCSKPIQKLEVPTQHIDGSQGDVHKEGNPHYWLDPNNGRLIAKQILDRLSQIDPKNKAVYEANYTVFIQTLDDKIKQWSDQLRPYRQYSFVTYHKVWSYFFDAFDLRSMGQLEPFPGIPPTSLHLQQLTQVAKQDQAPTLVMVATIYPKKSAQSFANTLGARLVVVDQHVQHNQTYFSLFDSITEAITQ